MALRRKKAFAWHACAQQCKSVLGAYTLRAEHSEGAGAEGWEGVGVGRLRSRLNDGSAVADQHVVDLLSEAKVTVGGVPSGPQHLRLRRRRRERDVGSLMTHIQPQQ